MKNLKQDGRKIPREKLEAMRKEAIQRVLAGESPENVIQGMGLHRSRIYAWIKRYQQEGESGLITKPIPGRPAKTPSAQTAAANRLEPPKPAGIEVLHRADTAPPPKSRIDEWVMILNKSLLDINQPLGFFLTILGNSLKSVGIITPNLRTPTSPLRPLMSPENVKLISLIEVNKRVTGKWYSNPFIQALTQPGDICTLPELIPRNQWHKNEYINMIGVKSSGDVIGMAFAGPADTLCGLFFSRYKNQLAFTEQDKRFLLKLRRHLEIAMELTARYWISTFTMKALAEATDHLDIAAAILDGNGEIINLSGAAGEMVKQQRYLKQIDHRLHFIHADDQKNFERAMKQSIVWRQAPIGNKPVEAMRFEYPSGDWIGVLVQPITPPSFDIPHSAVISPHVVVYISDPNKPRANPQHQLIMRLFQLTTREAQLTTLLTSNHSLEEAAKIMDITLATARTYLQHIYEKVGVNKRQDLIQRITKSVALLA